MLLLMFVCADRLVVIHECPVSFCMCALSCRVAEEATQHALINAETGHRSTLHDNNNKPRLISIGMYLQAVEASQHKRAQLTSLAPCS